jgi:glycosyltransferase involved in cell wall biosynthesis
MAGNYDIYHQTHYDPYAYKYIPNTKKGAMTIYDMNFFTIPQFYTKSNAFEIMRQWQKTSSQKAANIIAISENTKKDIIETFGISDDKIKTIYLGIDNIDLDKYHKERICNNPYILFVGVRCHQKNFENCLKSFKIISEKRRDLLLICSGLPFQDEEKKTIEELKLKDKIIQISANEVEMINLYYNAELFIYPSYYEGFGMPLLEAMACHCPVVCSNTSCFPEIAKDAAMYFDPYSIENMTEIVKKVLDDNTLRNDLIKKGIQRKNLFSWKKCADEHFNVYRELV